MSTMEQAQAEHSANLFGVKLRRVTPDKSGSNEKINTAGRKSTPPGAPSNCENRANQRKSMAPSSHQVALRQEIAEKQAIQRQKKNASRSWDKRSKPSIPCKPVMKPSSSLGNIPKSTNSGPVIKRTVAAQRKSPLVSSSNTNKTHKERSQRISDCKELTTGNGDRYYCSSWLSPAYELYDKYKPILESIYLQISQAANRQGQYKLT